MKTSDGSKAAGLFKVCSSINIPGMCGHLVIAEIYNRIGIAIPPLSHSQEAELASSPHTDRLMATLHRASHAWTQVNASPQLQTFA